MLCDLNIRFPLGDFNEKVENAHISQTKSMINMAMDLGYTHLALNFCPETPTSGTNKNKISGNINEINPINLNRDFKEYKDKVKLFTRITVKVDDPGQCQNFAKFQQVFDIVAVEPITEKAFQSSISNLEIDLISFNLCTKFPCFMKHKAVGSAIEKGIKFELRYSHFLPNPSRALAISNAKQIIRASRGSGMICSSGALLPAQMRNVHNVKPLLQLIGVKTSSIDNLFNAWALKVLMRGKLRVKSYKQTVVVKDDDGLLGNANEDGLKISSYKRPLHHDGSPLPSSKKLKTI